METLQTICIALIQGITEFLPISSSAHVQLPGLLLDWQDRGQQFDVAIHAGSLLAVLVFFRKQLSWIIAGSYQSLRHLHINEHSDLALKLLVATLPVAIAGFFLRTLVADMTRELSIVVFATLFFGGLLGLADWRTHVLKTRGFAFAECNPSYLAVMIIGCAQSLALIPGTSRSGITITAALLLGLSRSNAARFSFLLSIPVISGAFSLTLYDLSRLDESINWTQFGLGFFVAVISSFVCIAFFLNVIEKTGLWPFVAYRLLIGTVLGLTIWL